MKNLHDLFNMGDIPELSDRESSAQRRLNDAFMDVSAALGRANVEESLRLEVHAAEIEFVAALTAKVQSQQDEASLVSLVLGAAAGIVGVESSRYAYDYGFASGLHDASARDVWIPTCTKTTGGTHCEFFVPDDQAVVSARKACDQSACLRPTPAWVLVHQTRA